MPKSDGDDTLFSLLSGESWKDLSLYVCGTKRFRSGKGRQLDILTCKPMEMELVDSDLKGHYITWSGQLWNSLEMRYFSQNVVFMYKTRWNSAFSLDFGLYLMFTSL